MRNICNRLALLLTNILGSADDYERFSGTIQELAVDATGWYKNIPFVAYIVVSCRRACMHACMHPVIWLDCL